MEAARKALKDVFGYTDFRPFQEEAISRVLSGRDCLAVMPTGGGKSLCYQIPALVLGGPTLVVSPLIALMADQVAFLRDYGVPAAFLNSSLGKEEYADTSRAVREGRVKILYAAPETLLTPRFMDLASAVGPACLAIDEAHCISEWGHDFRPEYRRLAEARSAFPGAVCLALTATATPRVRSDIRRNLGIPEEGEIVASFDRPNLFLEVKAKRKPFDQLLDFLSGRREESGIVYCFSRARTDEVAEKLRAKGFSALAYHAGLGDDVRTANQESFIRDETQIMAATVAFGMGIDKPNVRFVVHYDMPKSLENYYQEVGRAGRDGLPARGLFLYSYSDAVKLSTFLDRDSAEAGASGYVSDPGDGAAANPAAKANLKAVVDYAETTECRRRRILAHFGEDYGAAACGSCDACLASESGGQALADITTPALKFLSCVKRSGERFGAGHVIEVLRGSKSERVLRLGHDALSTYGIGADWDEAQWFDLSRQLERQGFLRRLEEGGGFALTPKAYEAFKTKGPISGRLPEPKAKRSRLSMPATPPADLSDSGEALRQALRHFRRTIAEASKLPPYVIFSDRTLLELVARKPASETELLEVFGMGTVKAKKYGEGILALVREARA